ncbi:LuxR C-terminal-related transcriptional regulator [Kitasatospora mediocidica]|uniref:LuxR C-terminal-related transcriptional regulator n=1 Tax=Kitasatospora mediocidica TaxID=58352 RepID=UPI00056AA02A|nr:helix-turn-helix transcriptional regulator [Kitasatospora mediocidica]
MVSEATWEQRLARSLAPAGDASGGAGPVVFLVEGTAGTGKSRLADRLLGLPQARAVPRLVVAFGAGGLAAGSGPVGPSPDPGDPDPPLSEQLARWRAAAGPGLLVAEDVHRADAAALAALRQLLESRPAPVACVLTYRPEELAAPGLPLGRGIAYPAGVAVLRIRLAPLDPAQVRRIAVTALGEARCPADFTARLHERSGGTARVVADLVELLAMAGGGRERFAARDVDAVGVPVRLAETVLVRTAALAERPRRVVAAAAVLAEHVSAAELVTVAGLDADEGREALLAALRGAALSEDGDGRYGFREPLAGAAVHRELPGPVRQELHRRAAEVLSRRQPVPWATVADHRRSGGPRGAWLRAVERAARLADRVGEHQAATALLEQTLAAPGLPGEARARLAPLLARSAVLGLGSEQTVTVLRQIVDDQELAPAVRGEVRLDLGLLLCNQVGRRAQGTVELLRAVEELSERPVLAARAMSALAMPYWPGASWEENLTWIERAEATAERSGDPVVRMAVRVNRVAVLMNVGDPSCWQLLDALPRDSEELACRQHVARGLCNAADAAVWLGHYRRADELLAEGVELAVRSGAAYTEQTGRSTVLLLDWAGGRWSGLAARAREFVADAGEMPVIAADAHVVLGLLALARGEWAQVEEWLAMAGSPAGEDGAVPLTATASGARIRLALARQEVAAAAQEAERAWAGLRRKGVWVWGAELAPWAAQALAADGRAAAAQALVAEFAAGLEGRDAPSASAALLCCRAVLAEAAGDPQTAAGFFRQAAAAYEELARPYAQALAVEGAGRCALGPVADGTATAELTGAAQRLEDLGAVWDAARARATLRAHQPSEDRRAPGRPGYGDQLSPREQEVAELAGTGLTNREIAGTLHLSPRTVEQHVARAMRKLGRHSRQDLGRPQEL